MICFPLNPYHWHVVLFTGLPTPPRFGFCMHNFWISPIVPPIQVAGADRLWEWPPSRLTLDCYTILACWHSDCQWDMRHGVQSPGITLLWLVGLNKGWDCLNCNGLWAHMWECLSFFRGHWQSPCRALTAGKCLPIVLCKETVKVFKAAPVTPFYPSPALDRNQQVISPLPLMHAAHITEYLYLTHWSLGDFR